MAADAEPGSAIEWHRRFGGEAFSAAWAQIENEQRTPDDDLQMLPAAAASRWHKDYLGEPERSWLGDWQVAHVAALLGVGQLALAFARRSLAAAEAAGRTGWRLASAHEAMARASAIVGDAEDHRGHLDAARAALAEEPDERDRAIIAGQIATVPDL